MRCVLLLAVFRSRMRGPAVVAVAQDSLAGQAADTSAADAAEHRRVRRQC